MEYKEIKQLMEDMENSSLSSLDISLPDGTKISIQKENNEENIYRALQIACADEFVRKLDKGLDTLLGEKGTGLSEGQMQRIAIARAVFSEHPILILDEATSALDKTTAIKLLKNLRKMTDRTVLLVTHRIEQIEIFDKTVSFFKEGSWQISVTDKKEE